MQPSEFWNLSPQEFWWEYDFRLAAQKKVTPGANGFMVSEWEEARKKHREKMNGNSQQA